METINCTVSNLRNAHLAFVTSSTTAVLNSELAVSVLTERCASWSSCSAQGAFSGSDLILGCAQLGPGGVMEGDLV